MEKVRIVIFAGPTGGHFFPALAFAEAFQRRHPGSETLLVTGERGRSLAEQVRNRFTGEFAFLPDFPFPRLRQSDFLIRILSFLLKLLAAFFRAGRIFETFKPQLAVGFGSYVSFPGLWECRRRKIPILIHEQNRKMGRSNAWAAGWANRIALSFETEESLRTSRVSVWTGLPLRASLIDCAHQKSRTRRLSFSPDRTRILVLGGSQGSQALNRLWTGVIDSFSNEEKCQIAVIHITGKESFETFKAMYFSKGIEAWVAPFHERMEELFSEADAALTRSGAGTLFELALFGLPAVVIPYPGAEGHQEENARFFADRGAVCLLRENECTVESLKKQVLELIHSKTLRERLSSGLSRLSRPDSAERLVDVAEELLTQKETCLA